MNPQEHSVCLNMIVCRDDYLKAAHNAAATRAYKLAARMGMTREEREDLTQDLLADLLEQAQHYDPARGSPGTFTGKVSQNRAIELLDRYVKDKTRLAFVSTVAANDGAEETGDVLDEGGVIPLWSVDDDLFTQSMALRDLEKAIRYMNDEQRALLDLLQSQEDMASACRAYAGSTATFYRRVSDLKMHLRMFGLRSAA
jgi:DNA-directed RNA polymerase specialized sigma24 family protein